MRNILIVLLTWCSISVTTAQQEENALLWEVSGDELAKPSYIFGILKFIPADEYYMPDIVKSKLNESQILATETHLDHHARHELNKAAHLEHHQSIEDFLTAEEYEVLNRIFSEQLDVSDFKFNLVYKKFKPIMLSTTMTRLSLGENVRYYELELINWANDKGIPTMALENVESEVRALEKIKLEDQVKALKHTLENFNKQLEDYDQLVEFYKNGNLHKTLEYTMHPIEANKDYSTHFIFGRNKSWIPKIEDYMRQGSTFFAIGASHLSEDEGVLELLRNKGYTVKPVK